MAEANRSGILAKAQKRLSRTKTKVLQSLGKADKSTDESFDDLVQKTEKQHEVAHHLQKEIKAYLGCVRALGQASKSLSAAISQTYEEGWTEDESFKKNVENLDLLWDDYSKNISEEVMEPMTQYIHSFPALKTRISKRGRKMMDYDNSRHNLEVLNAAKKKDESKVLKAQEDFNECKKIYEELHSELSKELPDFYNSRVTFYAQMFEKFFEREHTLHSEVAKISKSLTQIARKLSTDNKQFVYEPKRPVSKSVSDNSDDQMTNGEPSPRLGATIKTSLSNPVTSPFTSSHTTTVDDEDHLYCNQDELGASVNGKAENSPKKNHSRRDEASGGDAEVSDDDSEETSNVYALPKTSDDSHEGEDEDYQTPVSNMPIKSLPSGTLYQVEATHAYKGEDIDELSFVAGDIINVIPYENDEEQDEGWQMGIMQNDGRKGVFPENFTRRF